MRFIIAGAMFPALAATAREVPLTGPQIRATISGKYVTDERQRSARWSVKGNQLCLLQPEISKDEPICYQVLRDGQELQYKDDAQFVVYRGLVRPMPKREP
jgi:hypothetical protein